MWFIIVMGIIIGAICYESGKSKQSAEEQRKKSIENEKRLQEEYKQEQLEKQEIAKLAPQYIEKLKIKLINTIEKYEIKIKSYSIDTIIEFFDEFSGTLGYSLYAFNTNVRTSKQLLTNILEIDTWEIKKSDILFILKCIKQYKICDEIIKENDITFPKSYSVHNVIIYLLPLKNTRKENIIDILKKEQLEARQYIFENKLEKLTNTFKYNNPYKYKKFLYGNYSDTEFSKFKNYLYKKYTFRNLEQMSDDKLLLEIDNYNKNINSQGD